MYPCAGKAMARGEHKSGVQRMRCRAQWTQVPAIDRRRQQFVPVGSRRTWAGVKRGNPPHHLTRNVPGGPSSKPFTLNVPGGPSSKPFIAECAWRPLLQAIYR